MARPHIELEISITSFFISRRALAREGDYEMMSVCACVRALVGGRLDQRSINRRCYGRIAFGH